MLKKVPLGGVLTGTAISMMMHVSLVGGLYYWFFLRQPSAIVAELDLSQTPLVPPNMNRGAHHRNPPPDWIFPKKEKAAAPLPVKARPVPVETKDEVKAQEDVAPPCVDCTETAADGSAGYIDAALAARKPRWIRNLITSRDYPAVARQDGKDGRVVLTVIIGDDGRVKDARLLEGSYDILNEVALRKVKEAVFTPAYDASNKPVSCRVTLPIRFELR